MFHILVVEDDKELCGLFSKTLMKNGYYAVSAEDAKSALAVLEKEYIDLMITDVMMPGMNGFELIEAMRGGEYHGSAGAGGFGGAVHLRTRSRQRDCK